MSDRRRQNEEVARRLWRGASEGDPGAFGVFAPDVAWRTYGKGPNAGEFRGLDQVMQSLAVASQRADDLKSELIDILTGEGGATIHFRTRTTRGSKILDAEYFMWLEIGEGVVTRASVVPLDQRQVDAFWRDG